MTRYEMSDDASAEGRSKNEMGALGIHRETTVPDASPRPSTPRARRRLGAWARLRTRPGTAATCYRDRIGRGVEETKTA